MSDGAPTELTVTSRRCTKRAHLDRETEALVMRDIIPATETRTVLLATHRRDTLVGLDAVLDITRQLQPA